MVVVHVHAERADRGGCRALELHPLVEEVDRVGTDQVRPAVEVRRDRMDVHAGVADEVTDVNERRYAEVAVVLAAVTHDRATERIPR